MTFRRMRRDRRRPQPTTDRRSPEARLEAMVAEKNVERRLRTFDRIRDDLDAKQNVAEWIAAVATLRDRLIVGEAETCHLAFALAESGVFDAAQKDAELVRIADEIRTIEQSHGLRDDESFHEDDAPQEWLELNAAWGARADQIIAQLFRDGGVADLATMYADRRAQFDERAEEGDKRLWGELDEDPDDDPGSWRGVNPHGV